MAELFRCKKGIDPGSEISQKGGYSNPIYTPKVFRVKIFSVIIEVYPFPYGEVKRRLRGQ